MPLRTSSPSRLERLRDMETRCLRMAQHYRREIEQMEAQEQRPARTQERNPLVCPCVPGVEPCKEPREAALKG